MSADALHRKTILVTSATSAVGRALCIDLAGLGARVVVHCNSALDRADAEQIVDSCIAAGGDAFAIDDDLATVASMERVLDTTVRRFGMLFAAINTAGVRERTRLTELTEELFDLRFDVNAKAALFLMIESAKRMEAGGRLITLTSTMRASPAAGTPLAHFTAGLAEELAERRVQVNHLAMGSGSDTAAGAQAVRWVRFLLRDACDVTGWTVFLDKNQTELPEAIDELRRVRVQSVPA